MKDFVATITGDGDRPALWREVMGGNQIVLKSPIPLQASLPGHENALIYEMDLGELRPDQRERLIIALARKFGVPVEDVAADLDEIGCPILADDVIVTVHNPMKWLT